MPLTTGYLNVLTQTCEHITVLFRGWFLPRKLLQCHDNRRSQSRRKLAFFPILQLSTDSFPDMTCTLLMTCGYSTVNLALAYELPSTLWIAGPHLGWTWDSIYEHIMRFTKVLI